MKKLDLKSRSPQEALIDALANMCPGVITETQDNNGKARFAIDLEQLQQEVSCDVLDSAGERYRMDWPGKRASLALANKPTTQSLRPKREESIHFDTTQNLFIEGDNLATLKIMQETYLNKVKLIYIDPPYNTGNDFIYWDDFRESSEEYMDRSGQIDSSGGKLVTNVDSNGRFHSDWLSMMHPLLRLARNLLTSDGVIFISIDDGEVANLRKLCEEVFGEGNLIANVIWEKKYTRANDAKWFSDNHDHILCFAKNKETFQLNQLPRTEKQKEAYKNIDNHSKGPWKATPLHAKSGSNTSPYTFKNGIEWQPPKGTFRRFNDEAMARMDDGDEIWFGSDGMQTPSRKSFLSEVKGGVTPVTIWPYGEVGHNHEANNNLKDLGLGGLFNNPKPVRLLEQILRLSTNKEANDLVLDFFSGSATTAHAVMQLNAKDGGGRRHIQVQLPEPCDEKSAAFKAGYTTIAEISKERIRRAGAKIRAELEAQLEGELPESDKNKEITAKLDKLDTGFRVLKVDSSNMADVYYQPDEVTQDGLDLQVENIKPDRTPEDLLFQVLLDWGVDLALPIEQETIDGKTVFFVDGNALAACFDPGLDEDFVKTLAKREPLRAVFRDASFATDATKINIEQIFKALSPHTELKAI